MTTKTKPKRRNAEQTKATILAAAQKAFSQGGYGHVGIRDIASIANVSSSLIDRYYGSKAALFEAALLGAMRKRKPIEVDRSQFGVQMSRRLIALDEDMDLLAMSVLSVGDAEAREITTRLTREHILVPLAKWLGGPNARARAARMLMMSTGFVTYTRQLPIAPVGGAIASAAGQWIARALQEIVDQSDNNSKK